MKDMMMKKTLLNGSLLALTLALSTFGGPAASPALAETTEAPAVAAPAAAVAVTDVDPAMWVVKDEDTTIYLFGTVHVLKPGLGWFDDAVKTAFDKSDRLVMEIVDPDPAQAQQIMVKYMPDNNGKTITSKLSAADKLIYDKAMNTAGLAIANYEPLDPWAVAIVMSMTMLQKSGYDPASGVETQLKAAAEASNKPIAGVETMEEQFAIFDALPEETQVKFLIEGAKAIDTAGEEMEKMVSLWAKPDPEGLAKLMNEGLTDPKLYDALLTKRNSNWAKWINEEMKKPGTTFMAVGAGHLSGDSSVQKLLEPYGIKAERVEY
jgi:uncharacterized protein